MQHCKNCGHAVQNAYCSHCGQKTGPERFTLAYLWKEVFHFFTHLDKGFLYTSQQMVLKPGQTVIDYVAGKRKMHQSPVSYFLIWTTAFILTLYLLTNVFGEHAVIDYKDYFGPGATTRFALSNLSFVLTFIIPMQALYLYLLVTRPRYNYVETIVMVLFAVGTIIQFQFVFALLSLLYFLATSMSVDLRWSDAFKSAYLIWWTVNFLRALPIPYSWLKGLLFILLAGGTFLAWRFFGVPLLAGYFLH